jgi:hypothetical protein
MRPQWEDTDPATENAYIGLLRKASPERRVELAINLSRTAVSLAYSNLRSLHPDASDQELLLLFVETHHGRELADGLRRRLLGQSR